MIFATAPILGQPPSNTSSLSPSSPPKIMVPEEKISKASRIALAVLIATLKSGNISLHPYLLQLDMLAKLTTKNQLTLPKSIVNSVPEAEYFEIRVEEGQIVLTPVRMQKADVVREKLAVLDISEKDVENAILWVRSKH